MSQRPTISAIVITKNEADNIEDCLKSIAWTDEIIVVDSGSTDGTVELARKYTDKVFETDWPGFGPQKNRALDKASSAWVLSIDADERITEELKSEILCTISSSALSCYRIPRLSSYCGKFLKHGGWWPDYVVRLFKKDSGRFSDSLVHEKVICKHKPGTLQNHIVHHTYRDVSEVIQMIDRYSSASALEILNKGRKVSFTDALTHAAWSFLRTYLFKLGFLDGKEGLMLATSNSQLSYYKYLKAYFLQKQKH